MPIDPTVLSSLISAGGSGLAGSGSFIGNMITSAVNSKRAWKYTQRAMALQDQYNRAYTRDSYSLMRQGLSMAGYNPLLALGSSANSSMPTGSGINSDSDNGSQAVTSAMDSIRLANETKIANKQSEKLNAEIGKIKSEKKDIDNKPHNVLMNEIKDFVENADIPKNLKKSYNSAVSVKDKYLPNLNPDLFSNSTSASSVQNKRSIANKLVDSAIHGDKKSRLLLDSFLSNPIYRSVLTSYVGYKTVKYLYQKLKNSKNSNYGHDKGYDFEYIKDKDLK